MGQRGTVTAIEVQKQHPHRRSIFVDGVFRLGIDAEVILRSGLQVGQILDDGDVENLLLCEEEKRAREYALNLLSFHDRSCREISDRLRQKGFEAETERRVVSSLVEAGLLDDARLARQWGAERLSNRPMGARLLAAELRRKGIDRETIDLTVEELYAGDGERSLAVRALAARQDRYRTLERPVAFRKMADFLLRRGFSWEVAEEAIKEFIENERSGEE